MSPLFVRIFTLVGMALAAASMQMKARADTPSGPEAQQVRVHHPAGCACIVAENDWRST